MLRFIILSSLLVAAVIAASATKEGRIVGGTDAALGEYPYVVSLKTLFSHSCGGSILSSNYVLTAAHCIDFKPPRYIQIQYGVVDIRSQENIVNVKRIIKHENYSPIDGYLNDVAILELEEPIKFGSNAKPVKLPEANEYPGDNATATLVGWGYEKDNSEVKNDLQEVQIILFTNEFCKSKEDMYNSNFQVCAGLPEGGKGQCSGDSGGPLTVDGTQYGIVSWSTKPCSSKGHPGIFAKVSQYRNWIREQSGV